MLFVAQVAETVWRVIGGAGVGDRAAVAVLGELRLARALRERGGRVVTVSPQLRPLRRSGGERICGKLESLPLGDRSIDVLVGLGIAEIDRWEDRLSAWSSAVRDGGLLVLVDRAEPAELSRRALCSGLAELEQRAAGRSIVTSGRVRRY